MAISEEAREVRLNWLESSRGPNPERIKIIDDGFVVTQKRWPLKPRQRPLAWKDVVEIHASIFDCYSCHPMELRFCLSDGGGVRATELMDGYPSLLESVVQAFPGFDRDVYDEVEGYFPGEGCRLCWRKE